MCMLIDIGLCCFSVVIVVHSVSQPHCGRVRADCVLLQDAFPPNFVKQNRFQRQATLLVYLNDVQTGGATHFDRLDVSIQPECGKALLFFPAFADGTPDPRCDSSSSAYSEDTGLVTL